MTLNIKLVEGPIKKPLDLATVKAHLRVLHDNEDDLITGLIDAVTSHLDGRYGILGRALITQIWELKLTSFPSARRSLVLPFPPLIEVVSIIFTDSTGQDITLPAVNYAVSPDEYEGSVRASNGNDWPRDLSGDEYPVVVRFTAGYGADPAHVPAAIRQAMLLLISRLYMCREDEQKRRAVMNSSDALLAPWRVGEMAL